MTIGKSGLDHIFFTIITLNLDHVRDSLNKFIITKDSRRCNSVEILEQKRAELGLAQLSHGKRELYFPENLLADFRLKTFNGGGAELRFNTFNADIFIRKAK
ncbi:MAG: hypothetical protein AB1715_07635 [Acidobacteriota bacterium]